MAQSKNKQSKAKPKTGKASGSRSKASVPTCGYPGTTGKPCGQTILTENGRCRRHADKPGAPKGNQNAVGHGAPEGNQNARKHGLFSPYLGADGLAIYQAAKDLQADEIGRETAEFLLAKLTEAYRSDQEWTKATGLVRELVGQLVDSGAITPEVADALANKLRQPDLGTLARVVGPLKNLLEVKKPKDNGPEDDQDFNGSLFGGGVDDDQGGDAQ